ncbi:hypothetical protein MVEN_00302700 [Mycena venus]|uniref:Uncharacterized protein n=1 Tax=Mycena venus TaxID=2733690 RepID=A0A8H6Z2Y3_9AGAR|nr:hypothetical protein MVEN_00302700 [Mycena venus]
MGTNTKQYICNCALAPEEHLVYLNKRRDHMENLARFEKAQHESAADLDKICDGVSNLNVRDGQGTDGVISLMQSLSLTQAMDMTTVLTLTDNGPDLSRSLPRNPVASNTVPLREATRSVEALLASHPRHVDKVKMRHAEILEQVAKKMSDAQASLEIAEDFNLDDVAHVAQMRCRLNFAVDASMCTEKSLRPLPQSAEKESLIAALRELEIKINLIGTVLPPDTTPLRYDASYIHEDPVKQLDLIAQVMILLGIICHVIVGLGTDPANFILDSVTLIIKLVMSMKLEKKEDGTEGYDAEQQDLLEQLPSSLLTPKPPKMKKHLFQHLKKEQNQIDSLHAILVLPLDGPAATIRTKGEFLKRVCRKNKKPLQHVCWSLGLDPTPNDLKADLAEKLWKWRLTKPRVSTFILRPKTMPPDGVAFIQKVIADTVTPAWINSVPKNYGQNNAGTIKADEWRVLATIYIPIALVLMWGDDLSGQHAAHFFTLLMHSMAVFQAATLACRYSTSESRASAYRNFIKHWIDQLHSLHPHAKFHDRKKRPNIHAAFHIFDFLRLFGPVISWWSFPFERLIGVLQRINTNDHIGGEMEASILKSFMRGANLRRWLNRSDCPQVIREFKRLFNLAFTPRDFREETPPKNDQEHAHYNFQGVNYSRASTHLGNSLVLFYPLNSTQATAGSIEKITGAGKFTRFFIRRQAPLPANKHDPFTPFPHFPAKTYSSKMMGGPLDEIHPDRVLSHCARFTFSDERAVILNLSRD